MKQDLVLGDLTYSINLHVFQADRDIAWWTDAALRDLQPLPS